MAQHYIDQAFARKSSGRVVLSSCMPQQKALEDKRLGHGLFTYYLLEALEGKAPLAVERDGWVTIGSVFSYLSKMLPLDQRPVKSGVEQSNFQLLFYPEHAEKTGALETSSKEHERKHDEKAFALKAMLVDHSGLPVADGQKATLSIAVVVSTVVLPCF